MTYREEFESLANNTLGSLKRWEQGIYVKSYKRASHYGMCAALSALWLSSRKQTRDAGQHAYRSAFEDRVAAKAVVEKLQHEIAGSVESADTTAIDQLLFIDNYLRNTEGFLVGPNAACLTLKKEEAPFTIADFVRAEAGYYFIGCCKAQWGNNAHAVAAENVDGKDHIVFFDPNFGRVTWGHDAPHYGGKAFTVFFTTLSKSVYNNTFSEFIAKRYH